MLTYLLLSVVDTSWNVKLLQIGKDYNIEIKQNAVISNSVKLFLIPSVVDISGAKIKRAVVNNKKRLKDKNKTKYYNLK